MLSFFESISDTISSSIPHRTNAWWPMLYGNLTITSILKAVLLLLVILNLKVFPFIYHLRFLNAVRFVLKSQRPPQPIGPAQLFQPLITSSRACLMEIDVFGHKSNSTYFLDVDIARAHLVTTMFSTAIEKLRGSTTMNGLSGKPKSNFTLALGAVSCTFRQELRPYEEYDMWTRILCWDHKWFYLVTHFVKKGANLKPGKYTLYPRQNNKRRPVKAARSGVNTAPVCAEVQKQGNTKISPVCASALSKIVFKNSRITIAPETMLEAAGLLPSECHVSQETPGFNSDGDAPGVATPSSTASINTKTDIKSLATGTHSLPSSTASWILETIEAERQRGMEIAKLLGGQTVLEDEFNHEVALGRHYDGHGIEGVLATFAQLGKISRYQLL